MDNKSMVNSSMAGKAVLCGQQWGNKAAKWEVWEAVFYVAGEFDNPFADVCFQMELQCKERVFLADGFYDGEADEDSNFASGKAPKDGYGAKAAPTAMPVHAWKFRFAPMSEGEWSFKTVSDCGCLDGICGSFACTKAISRGGLAISKDAPHWFSREDGSAQFIVNDGWFPHAANGRWVSYEEVDFKQPSEQDMLKYIDLLSEYGVNMVIDMSQLYARQKSITDTGFAWPWKVTDPENNKIDRNRFNLGFYRRWERILEHCGKKGMFFAVELLFDNSTVRRLEWSHHPVNAENGGWLEGDGLGLGWSVMFDLSNETHRMYTARYLRYTIARLSAYKSVLWELGGENANLSQLPDWMLPGGSLPDEPVAAWYNYWGEFVKQWDPCKRPCTYGDVTYQKDMVKGPGNDWILTQDPRNYSKKDIREYFAAMSRYGAWYWQYDRPMVIGEMNSFNNGNYGRERRFYWTAMASGYYMGRSDRHFAIMHGKELEESIKFGPFAERSESDAQVPDIYVWLKIMREFVEGRVSYTKMHPANECVQTSKEHLIFCLADEGREYLLYMPFGGEGRLMLEEEMPCQAVWLNPRTGKTKEGVMSTQRSDADCREAAAKPSCYETLAAFTAAQKPPKQTRFFITVGAPDGQDWVLHIKIPKN